MTIAMMGQPGLFPWWGTFAKAAVSDVTIHLDHVSWQKGGYLNRFLLETPSGPVWCTVPLQRPRRGTPIADVRIARPRAYLESHRSKLGMGAWEDCRAATDLLSQVYESHESNAADLAIASTELTADYLGISTHFVRSSQLPAQGHASYMIAGLLAHIGAKAYVFGPGRRGIEQHYLDVGLLQRNGIRVGLVNYAAKPRVSILQDIACRGRGAMGGRTVTVEWLS